MAMHPSMIMRPCLCISGITSFVTVKTLRRVMDERLRCHRLSHPKGRHQFISLVAYHESYSLLQTEYAIKSIRSGSMDSPSDHAEKLKGTRGRNWLGSMVDSSRS